MQLNPSVVANTITPPFPEDRPAPRCRFCGSGLEVSFADLGMTPPSNAYLRAADLGRMESFFPLHAYVCSHCYLVQLEQFQTPGEIFGDYAYFSSYSASGLFLARRYAVLAVGSFDLGVQMGRAWCREKGL